MKKAHILLAILFTIGAAANAQVVPEATGPHRPSIRGTLDYSVRYSQVADIYGGGMGDQQNAIISGDVKYVNDINRLPFSMLYGGGYDWTLSGPSGGNGFFENLLLSQGIVQRDWSAMFSDNVSYRKQSPTTGFSGIPGTGEPVVGPTPPSDETILTLDINTLENVANGEYKHDLTSAIAFSAGGGYEILRFPDGNGMDTNSLLANAGISQRLNTRNTLTSQYAFTDFSYPGSAVKFSTDAVLFGLERVWNRKITSNVSAGPEWIYSSDNAVVPSSTIVTVNALVNYKYRDESVSLDYSRGTNGGGGYLLGGEFDSVTANIQREFQRKLMIELTGGYRRTAGLANNGVTDAKFGAVQATRQLGKNFSIFASFTATVQSTSSTLPANALGQLLQVYSFGIGYSSRPMHLRE